MRSTFREILPRAGWRQIFVFRASMLRKLARLSPLLKVALVLFVTLTTAQKFLL